MDHEPPDLTLVSSRDDAAIAREHCSWELDHAMRELAANILRIAADGGRPWELVDQIIAVREAMANAPAGFTVNDANDAMAAALGAVIDELETDMGYAEKRIQQGALRKIAARLLHQQAQEARRNADMWDAINDLDRIRDATRKRMEAEWAASKPSPRTKRRRINFARDIVAGRVAPLPEPVTATPTTEQEPEPKSTVDFMRRRQRDLRGHEE
jgi:hypothetical protein